MARPSKLSPDVQHRLVAAFRAGITAEAAADAAGIGARTYHRWVARGAAEAERVRAAQTDLEAYDAELPKRRTKAQHARLAQLTARTESLPEERPYADLVDAATTARAEGRVALVALINRASRDDWRAAAWLLERQDPDNWARRDRLAVQAQHGGQVDQHRRHEVTDARELADAGHDVLRAWLAERRSAAADSTREPG